MDKTQPRFPGQIKARAYYDLMGNPKLEIELEEMARLEQLLKEQLGRDATIAELFDYVLKATQQ